MIREKKPLLAQNCKSADATRYYYDIKFIALNSSLIEVHNSIVKLNSIPRNAVSDNNDSLFNKTDYVLKRLTETRKRLLSILVKEDIEPDTQLPYEDLRGDRLTTAKLFIEEGEIIETDGCSIIAYKDLLKSIDAEKEIWFGMGIKRVAEEEKTVMAKLEATGKMQAIAVYYDREY